MYVHSQRSRVQLSTQVSAILCKLLTNLVTLVYLAALRGLKSTLKNRYCDSHCAGIFVPIMLCSRHKSMFMVILE